MLLKMTLILCGILIKTDYKQLNRFVMKTKLFIVMLLLPLMFGCSKESDTIVGD